MRKALLYIFYGAGLLGLAVFIITKNEYLMTELTRSMNENGDLYRFARVRQFKVPFPAEVYPDEEIGLSNLDSIRVFMIGDSFMESCRGHQALPVELSAALAEPIHVVQAGDSTEYFNPLYLFKKARITKGPPRIVILERVERYIIDNFSDPMEDDPRIEPETPAPSGWGAFERRWFTGAERNYEVLLTSSSITAPVIELWNTACFTVLGRISEMTPVYSLNPPFLFYEEEVSRVKLNSFYAPHPDSSVEEIADYIAAVRSTLQKRYNTELVFMAIPNSYTIYHKFVNNDIYDNYLPRLEKYLNQRGVRTIDLYERYIDSKEIVYFPTDSHWNALGCEIALHETLRQLREMGWGRGRDIGSAR